MCERGGHLVLTKARALASEWAATLSEKV